MGQKRLTAYKKYGMKIRYVLSADAYDSNSIHAAALFFNPGFDSFPTSPPAKFREACHHLTALPGIREKTAASGGAGIEI